VLVGHAIAYGLTGEEAGSLHEYLAHGPQIAAILATVGLASLAVQQRSDRLTGPFPYAALGVAGFTAQEHLERVAHSGDVPWLLGQPTFLVGLALQLPAALACVWLARTVLRAGTGGRAGRPPAVSSATVPLTSAPVISRPGLVPVRPQGRGPPGALPA
jgi:hypothetical protein